MTPENLSSCWKIASKSKTSYQKDKKTKERPRKCPICLKAMDKILCGKEKKVLIDKCRRDHGLWFDKSELPEIIEMGSIDKDNKILTMLEDIFQMRP